MWPQRLAVETLVEKRCWAGCRGHGRVRSLQKRRTARADQLFFLRAQKMLRKLQAGREMSREGMPFEFWKVKSLMDN